MLIEDLVGMKFYDRELDRRFHVHKRIDQNNLHVSITQNGVTTGKKMNSVVLSYLYHQCIDQANQK